MMRQNALEDLITTNNLNGLVFKRKSMDTTKLKGLGYFGLAGSAYAYYPYIVAHLGQTLTTFSMTAACLAGMSMLSQREPIINTIEIINEGPDSGKLRINYQKSLLSSKTIMADVGKTMSIASLGNDDQGEADLESNIVNIDDYLDVESGERKSGQFILPADAFKDFRSMDWILSIKS